MDYLQTVPLSDGLWEDGGQTALVGQWDTYFMYMLKSYTPHPTFHNHRYEGICVLTPWVSKSKALNDFWTFFPFLSAVSLVQY